MRGGWNKGSRPDGDTFYLIQDNMPVTGGRFMGSTTANSQTYDAVGQFGGANQAGVVGHATGSDFRSVFYGDKN